MTAQPAEEVPAVSAPPVGLRRVDVTLGRPEEDLALDEALLHALDREILELGGDAPAGVPVATETGEGEAEWRHARRPALPRGYLRFWESPVPFVVLGVSGRVREEVHIERCRADGIPVLRRGSGGGTVLQGPGCLNFAVVLPLGADARLRDVHASYRVVVERSARALGLEGAGLRGTSDLARGDVKFGGSAQKRTARALLHHATVLYGLDLELVDRYLREPAKQPEYRRGRPHREFIANLDLPAALIRDRIARAWHAEPAPEDWTPPPLDELLRERYARREWHERF